MAIPLIILGSVGLSALVALLGGEKDDTFTNADIISDYLCNATDFKTDVHLKQHVTRVINSRVLPKHRFFKIGKSGSVNARIDEHKSKQPLPKYKKMYLLVRSTDKTVINKLEAYYNHHYIQHHKNDNKRGGSAGQMSSVDHFYYLYVVVR